MLGINQPDWEVGQNINIFNVNQGIQLSSGSYLGQITTTQATTTQAITTQASFVPKAKIDGVYWGGNSGGYGGGGGGGGYG